MLDVVRNSVVSWDHALSGSHWVLPQRCFDRTSVMCSVGALQLHEAYCNVVYVWRFDDLTLCRIEKEGGDERRNKKTAEKYGTAEESVRGGSTSHPAR